MNRVLILIGISFLICLSCDDPSGIEPKRPNIVFLLADDMGYGDIASYGHPTIKTPNLDIMAIDGQKWTQFYSASSVCTPSRAALLTGRLPIRSGMIGKEDRVLFPDSEFGLPSSEITIAEKLSKNGYKTSRVNELYKFLKII